MSKKWRDILSDKNSYPDDFVIAMKDGSNLTLGQMRQEDKETEGALTQRLTAREQELTAKEQELGRASGAVAQMFEKYLEMTGLSAEEALAGKKPLTKKSAAAETGLDPNDPILAPMIKEVNAIKDQMAKLETENKTLRDNVMKPVVSQYLNDYYELTFDTRIAPKLPAKAKDKVTLDALMKHAEQNGLKDRSGRLNLSKAADELTQEYRTEDEVEKRVSKRMKELDDERTLASIQRPGHSGPRNKPAPSFVNDKGRVKNFDEVLMDAAQDTEMWAGIAKA